MKKRLSALLLVLMLAIGMPLTVNASFDDWWAQAQTIQLGQKQHYYEYWYGNEWTQREGGVFRFYVPTTLNINFQVISDSSSPLYIVSIYNSQGESVDDVYYDYTWIWKKNPVTRKSYFNLTKKLNKGYYYIECETEVDSGGGFTLGTSASLPSKPSIRNIRKISKKTATISWNKVGSVSGYQLYRSTSKKGRYQCVKTLSSKSGSYKNGKLKRKKTYYYKVRAYKKVNGKTFYSGFSAIKKIKM